MAWNPSPEVAAARDAAKALKADRTIVFFTRPDGHFGFASYGETKAKCAQAAAAGDEIWDDLGEVLSRVCR